MKAQPLKLVDGQYVQCLPEFATHLKIKPPGPIGSIILAVTIKGTRSNTPNWTWNGDIDKPTLMPSVLSRVSYGDKTHVCHSWITDGVAHFLSDSTHSFSGQSHDLLEIEPDNILQD